MAVRHKVGTIAGTMAVSLAFLSGTASAHSLSFNQKAASYVKQFVGRVPYRYGGSSPSTGFDCSGLVVYAANGAGIQVPRTAREQLGTGRPIARGAVRGGDLVFLHLARKELHVGIAIDGERFIHAPSAGGRVRVDSLAAPPYSKAFLGARRIIAAP